MKTLQRLTIVFWVLVAGIGLSLVGGIAQAIHEHQDKKAQEVPTEAIPVPALPQQ